MTADIGQGADHAVLTTHDDRRLAPKAGGDPIARGGDLALVTEQGPAAQQKVHVAREHLVGDIKCLWKRATGRPLGDQVTHRMSVTPHAAATRRSAKAVQAALTFAANPAILAEM